MVHVHLASSTSFIEHWEEIYPHTTIINNIVKTRSTLVWYSPVVHCHNRMVQIHSTFQTSFNKILGGNSTSHHQQQPSCHKARYTGSVRFPCASPHKSITCTNVATISKRKSKLVRNTQQVMKPLLVLQELIILSWQTYALGLFQLQTCTYEQFLQYNALTLISFSA